VEEREQARRRYTELKEDYERMRARAKNAYDFYNVIEKSVLEMEGSSENSERQMTDETLMKQGNLTREELNKVV
jgi:hypothetical protein